MQLNARRRQEHDLWRGYEVTQNATIDGATIAHELGDGIIVTSLAQGVPIGGKLDYLDDRTISVALKPRNAF